MKSPMMLTPRLLPVVIAAGFLAVLVLLGVMQLAFSKLGASPELAIWMFVASAFGSLVNLPIFTVSADVFAQKAKLRQLPDELLHSLPRPQGKMVVAVNLGGCVVPLVFSTYLIGAISVPWSYLLIACVLVSIVAYSSSALVPGVGVIMPMLTAPLAAALIGQGLDVAQAAPLAYVSATLGVLFGADVLRLRALGQAGESAVAIGGAGCFDGIFLAGMLAVLLA